MSALTLLFVCSSILVTCCVSFENLVQAHGEERKDLPAQPLNFAEPDWSLYHRTTELHNQLVLLTSTCRNVQAKLLLSTPDSSTSKPSILRLNNNNNNVGVQAQFPIEIGSDPLTAEEGLPYIILERGEDKERLKEEGENDKSTRNSFVNIFFNRVRKRESTKTNYGDDHGINKTEDSPIITTSMFVFGEEGRDLLSSEIALRIVQHICGSNINNNNTSSNATSDISLPTKTRLILVPIANPDGRRISEMGRRCDRTNAKDVDIDRNWPSFWKEPENDNDEKLQLQQPQQKQQVNVKKGILGEAVSRHLIKHDEIQTNELQKQQQHLEKSSTEQHEQDATKKTRMMTTTTTTTTTTENINIQSSSTSSSGQRPLSEPETRSLKSLIEEYKPDSYVSIRSGQLALTTPWDCNKGGTLHSRPSNRLTGVLKSITTGHCIKCKTGTTKEITGKYKCGTSLDHIYGSMNIKFVSSWYIYDGNQDSIKINEGDCFRKFNPVSKDRYNRICMNWMHAILNFTNSVRNWIVLEQNKGLHVAQLNATRSADLASERRAQALARGDIDPEEDDHSDSIDSTRNRYHEHDDTSNIFHHHHHNHDHSSSNSVGGSTHDLGGGIFGASAAVSTFALCLFIAKKFVFKSGPGNGGRKKKSRRQPLKNA